MLSVKFSKQICWISLQFLLSTEQLMWHCLEVKSSLFCMLSDMALFSLFNPRSLFPNHSMFSWRSNVFPRRNNDSMVHWKLKSSTSYKPLIKGERCCQRRKLYFYLEDWAVYTGEQIIVRYILELGKNYLFL